jgi:hypothetical protein
MAFDTLAYAQRLKAAGFTDAQAEALAEASREMIADEMVTKAFLQSELAVTKAFLQSELSAGINQLRSEMHQSRLELEMRLTLRMGAMAIAVVAALAAIIKL